MLKIGSILVNDESGFVLVGKTDGDFLINTDLVELAFIDGAGNFVFRVGGHNRTFSDPGDFDFSALSGSPEKRAAAPAAADWDEVKKNGG